MPKIIRASTAPSVVSLPAAARGRSPRRRRRAAGRAVLAALACGAVLAGPRAPAQTEEEYPLEFACLGQPGPLEVVSGQIDNGKFEPAVAQDKKFDARTATFVYPETISHSMVPLGEKGGSGASDMCWAGGFFTASTSWHALDISWRESKEGHDDTEDDRGEMNNTTAATSYENRMTWSGLHVYNMHDALRTTNTHNNWTVQHVWFDYIRDDCIENDNAYSGTVYDSLFDGCYTGFSAQADEPGQGEGQVVTMDRVLLRMEPMPYPYKWDEKDDPVVYVDGHDGVPFGHGSIFKLEEGFEPEFAITDSVFLQEYHSDKNLFPPADRVIACENNTIIWLGGPETAPTHLLDEFPDCFTLITDEWEGRMFWRDAVADWHSRHPEVGKDRKPMVPGEYSWPRFGASPVFEPAPSPEEPGEETPTDEEPTGEEPTGEDPTSEGPTDDWKGPKHFKGKGRALGHS